MAKADPEKNILFSPFLVRLALMALYRGARGETVKQLKELTRLHLFRDLNKVPQALKEAMSTVPYGQTEYGYLYLANFLHAPEGDSFQDDFVTAAQGSHLELFAGTDDLGADREAINVRVGEKTEHHIDELVTDEDVNELSSISIASAFVYKGLWAFEFDPAETRPTWFYSHGGTRKVEIPMMRHKGRFRFGINDRAASCRILELPMGEGGLATFFILPKDIDGLPKLEQRFNADIVRMLRNSLMEATVTVVMPVISLDVTTSLGPFLQGMEAPYAFDSDKADFQGAFDKKGPFISNVRHRGVFNVSEGGKSDPLPSTLLGLNLVEEYFVADHPFLFVLKDNKSDLIHMVGRYQFPPDD